MTMAAAALGMFRNALSVNRPWSRPLAFVPGLLTRPVAAERQYEGALRALAARPDDVVAIDVQLPFCPMLCSYCSANVTVTHDPGEIDRYVAALEAEIGLVADRLGPRREVVQVHFGGGTPNYLSEHQLGRIMAALRTRFRLLPETDCSIDCDPRRASARQLDALRALGFDHVRFGMADLQPEVQRAVGRLQSTAMVRDVCAMAGEAGFATVAIDLLYGLPGQTERSLRDTLAQVVDMGVDRIRCHAYLHRPGERQHQCAIDSQLLPGADESAALFAAAARLLTEAGYAWIGADHFVLDTDELAIAQSTGELGCNLIGYTARPRGHVVGFGAGALGDVDGVCVRNECARGPWQERVVSGELPVVEARRRSAEERACCEAAVRLACDLSLRTPRGYAAGKLARARLAPFVARGLVEMSNDAVTVTPQGHFALDALCAALQTPGTAAGVPGVRI